jgi:hypothetical protein
VEAEFRGYLEELVAYYKQRYPCTFNASDSSCPLLTRHLLQSVTIPMTVRAREADGGHWTWVPTPVAADHRRCEHACMLIFGKNGFGTGHVAQAGVCSTCSPDLSASTCLHTCTARVLTQLSTQSVAKRVQAPASTC